MSRIGAGQGQEGVFRRWKGVNGLSIHWALLSLGHTGFCFFNILKSGTWHVMVYWQWDFLVVYRRWGHLITSIGIHWNCLSRQKNVEGQDIPHRMKGQKQIQSQQHQGGYSLPLHCAISCRGFLQIGFLLSSANDLGEYDFLVQLSTETVGSQSQFLGKGNLISLGRSWSCWYRQSSLDVGGVRSSCSKRGSGCWMKSLGSSEHRWGVQQAVDYACVLVHVCLCMCGCAWWEKSGINMEIWDLATDG